MNNEILSSEGSDDSSIGFQKNIEASEKELTNNRTNKRLYLFKFFDKDVFCFAEHQEKAAYGLGQKLETQRNSDNFVLDHRARSDAENDALAGRVIIEDNFWYVPY